MFRLTLKFELHRVSRTDQGRKSRTLWTANQVAISFEKAQKLPKTWDVLLRTRVVNGSKSIGLNPKSNLKPKPSPKNPENLVMHLKCLRLLLTKNILIADNL